MDLKLKDKETEKETVKKETPEAVKKAYSVFEAVWQIVFPVIAYYLMVIVVYYIVAFVHEETLYDDLVMQILSSAGAFPVVLFLAAKSDTYRYRAEGRLNNRFSAVLCALVGVAGAVCLNHVLQLAFSDGISQAYEKTSEVLYSGTFIEELIGLCLISPFVEEMLYRGVIFGYLKKRYNRAWAYIVSSVIFGLVHLNLEQFVYALVFGLLLAFIADKTGNIFGAFVAHGFANLSSILREETSLFDMAEQGQMFYVTTVGAAITTVLILIWFCRKSPAASDEAQIKN